MSEDDSKHGMGEAQPDGDDDALTTNAGGRAEHAKGGGAYGTFTATNDGVSEGAR